MGLTQVDPSPVGETPIEYREKSYFPDQQQGESWGPGAGGVKRTGTLGLKLGDHGVVWWCTCRPFFYTHKPTWDQSQCMYDFTKKSEANYAIQQ
jgi:hypothetical protein